MSDCDRHQQRLAEHGTPLLERDADLGAHVRNCPACRAFAAALSRMEHGLEALPRRDPPEALRRRILAAVQGGSTLAASPRPPRRTQSPMATALGALAVLSASVGMVAGGLYDPILAPYRDTAAGFLANAPPGGVAEGYATAAQGDRKLRKVAPGAREYDRPVPEISLALEAPADRAPVAAGGRVSRDDGQAELQAAAPTPRASVTGKEDLAARQEQVAREIRRQGLMVPARKNATEEREVLAERLRASDTAEPPMSPAPEALPAMEPMPLMDTAAPQPETGLNAPAPLVETAGNAGTDRWQDATGDKRKAALAKQARGPRSAGAVTDELNAQPVHLERLATGVQPGSEAAARRFLAAEASLTGLTFKDPAGYWANTYVPGDPDIRLLESRLRGWDRQRLAALGAPRLEAAARQNPQPFDAPDDAALATYLQADRAALEGPSRLRVQVGLTATARRSGLRPDMNVAVVLDLRREPDDATAASLRALVMAMARARQPGDRFLLVAAGAENRVVTEPEAFRHGPLGIAMDELLRRGQDTARPGTDLATAIRIAADAVRQGDDPDRPLGASLVLLAATSPLGGNASAVDDLVHGNAVDGIALSVVAVGSSVPMNEVNRLVLLGQGQRSVLASAADAPRVVDRELHASSRAVARAVRLRIRLAPGVRLVDVIASRRLDDVSAERVREAEQSIDRRLARHLGIRADRGDDEEGIQIVIPAFYAGDSHAILLDVVADGPGPVADVTVRYKDLVFRRNGVARTNLTLPAGQRTAGPLERNVLKNRLAHELATSARDAAELMARGDWPGARALLGETRQLIAGMRALVPGWADDLELADDEQMLSEYLALLGSGIANEPAERRYVMDSLRYLAFRRLVPPRL